MTYLPKIPLPSVAFADVVKFVLTQPDAFLNAAGLLGGRPGLRRTSLLLQELANGAQCTPRICRELDGLHRLLSLECVSDPDSLEAACFAEIDPSDPAVEEICLLTDGLRVRLETLAGSGHDFPSLAAARAQ